MFERDRLPIDGTWVEPSSSAALGVGPEARATFAEAAPIVGRGLRRQV